MGACKRRLTANSAHSIRTLNSVESGCDAVTAGSGCLFPPLSSGGAQVPSPSLRFHTPLIVADIGTNFEGPKQLRRKRAATNSETSTPAQSSGSAAPGAADQGANEAPASRCFESRQQMTALFLPAPAAGDRNPAWIKRLGTVGNQGIAPSLPTFLICGLTAAPLTTAACSDSP